MCYSYTFFLYTPTLSHSQEAKKKNLERRVPCPGSSISLVNPTKSANLSPMEMQNPVPEIRTQSSPLMKPNLSAVSQWRSSRAAQHRRPVIRFIFMGNQPFFANGECNGEGSWGCRIMDPDELRNRLGIWRWRMHATWEPLIASRNLKRDHRGGVPAVRTANSVNVLIFLSSPQLNVANVMAVQWVRCWPFQKKPPSMKKGHRRTTTTQNLYIPI